MASSMKKTNKKKIISPEIINLDLGCGPNKKQGFIGVDRFNFPGVDVIADLTKTWPWEDGSVNEVHASHFVEHLDVIERAYFVNELYRVLIPDGKCTLIVPHWASCRAYGDPTHKWPAISEFWFYYLKKEWRMANAPHTDKQWLDWGYNCDFEVTWGYNLHPEIANKNQEYQALAMQFAKEACQDILANLTAKNK